jgi:hypothetical protein
LHKANPKDKEDGKDRKDEHQQREHMTSFSKARCPIKLTPVEKCDTGCCQTPHCVFRRR